MINIIIIIIMIIITIITRIVIVIIIIMIMIIIIIIAPSGRAEVTHAGVRREGDPGEGGRPGSGQAGLAALSRDVGDVRVCEPSGQAAY